MAQFNRFAGALAILAMLGFLASTLHAQPPGSYYGGVLEYSIPILTAVPPVDGTMPSDIDSAYLLTDWLMRTTPTASIDQFITNIGYNDTLKELAKMLYKTDDYNPLKLIQYEASGWPVGGHPDYPWHYKADPDHERTLLQNHIGKVFQDTARTGFLLASDIIADVTITDTSIKFDPSDHVVPHMVLVRSTINDEIKGKFIPQCTGLIFKAGKSGKQPLTAANVFPAIADTAAVGSCLNFEYSPEWQNGVFDDQVAAGGYLQDSTGWWIRPDSEYLVFLYLDGVNADTANAYFTIDPFWGVFGTQGAMYRVVNGRVVDPNDDFGLGGTNLKVAVWKTRLRARINNILNP
ncbi:MAG TPA: hypothetical protein VFH95_03730 [Candidatus Kapabacteria bacterium]|nr:hypothetical protein [Candidatus Kapabacteria bacterium]